MKALNTKLLRDLWNMRGQGLAIAAVIAIGVAMYVTSHTVIEVLQASQQSLYQRQQFAEVFANVKRAPESLAAQLSNIPGVAIVETRVQAPLNIQLPDYYEPITGLAISIPDGAQPQLNRLFLRAGQLPDAWHSDQIVISDAFAEAHDLHPGNRLALVINGRYQPLIICGIASSPEFISQMRPGDAFPDFTHYAILWMNRTVLESAFAMDGAFNSVVMSLNPHVNSKGVMAALDVLLHPWGGTGAYNRDNQLSNRYVTQELNQVKTLALILPMMFMGVAAFLLNVVTSRLIRTQRDQIAILKAFGYEGQCVMRHYLTLILLIVILGAGIGVPWGVWMAAGLADLYQTFFRFPWMVFRLQPTVAITAIFIAGAAAVGGTLGAVYNAYKLPPAEAMRPESPPHFHHTVLERLGARWMSQPSRIILRNLERQPLKAFLSVLGIGFAVALIMLSGFQESATSFMIQVQFKLAQKQDMTVAFTEPVAGRALYALRALTGVYYAESFRSVPVILHYGQYEYHTVIQGYAANNKLFTVLESHLRPITIPAEGVLLTDYLAQLLHIKPGDLLQISVQEGRRAQLDVPIAGLVTEYVGVGAYMQQSTLNRLLHEDDTISGAFLAVDPGALPELQRRLQEIPTIAGVVLRDKTVNAFKKMMDETIKVFTLFSLAMAGAIAFAVVYNNARIAFAERSRELASLRVLGFTQHETAYILLGELLVITLIALPLGFPIGAALCWLLTWAMQTDLYRVPLILSPKSYTMACVVVLVATLMSAGIIVRALTRLDIVSALKAAE